jgi:hypothetical protein
VVRDDDIGREKGANDEVQEVDALGQLAVAGVVVGVGVLHHYRYLFEIIIGEVFERQAIGKLIKDSYQK